MNRVKLPSIVVIFFCAIFILFSLYQAQAEVPKLINYQGKLTTAQGALVDTAFSMQFSIYSDSTGGDPLWTETQASVKVDKGIFNILLGSVNEIPESVFTGTIRYLGVKVGDDPEMTPRKLIVSVGYAYQAQNADEAVNSDMVDGRHANEFLRFIYQDSEEKSGNTSGVWYTVKSCTIPVNTITSKLIIYYDLYGGCGSDNSCTPTAQLTINGVIVDQIQVNTSGHFDDNSKFRSIAIEVDNSVPLEIKLNLAGYLGCLPWTNSFLILGN